MQNNLVNALQLLLPVLNYNDLNYRWPTDLASECREEGVVWARDEKKKINFVPMLISHELPEYVIEAFGHSRLLTIR